MGEQAGPQPELRLLLPPPAAHDGRGRSLRPGLPESEVKKMPGRDLGSRVRTAAD